MFLNFIGRSVCVRTSENDLLFDNFQLISWLISIKECHCYLLTDWWLLICCQLFCNITFCSVLITIIRNIFCSDVYSICVAHPEPMADRLYAETKQYLIDHVAKLLNKVQEEGEHNLVKNYFLYWSQYSVGSRYLHSLYLYLNQQHIRTQKLSDAEIIYGISNSSSSKYFFFWKLWKSYIQCRIFYLVFIVKLLI